MRFDHHIMALSLRKSENPPKGFLTNQVLDEHFYASVKENEIPGFEFGFLNAYRSGEVVATVPYFITHFQINTMLDEGFLKKILGNLGFKMAAIGHPIVAFGQIDGEVSSELLSLVFNHLKKFASVISFKGFPDNLPAEGFVKIKGLPVAVLNIDENFWTNFSSSAKRNFKRKRKISNSLAFKISDGLPNELVDLVYQLYLQTCRQSSIQFAELSKDYFLSTSFLSHYVFAYLEGQLVGFTQVLIRGEVMDAGFIGIDQEKKKTHGVYFSLIMQVIDLAIQKKCKKIEMGETHYYFKKALGGILKESFVYFRHRNTFFHLLMSKLSFLFEPSEKELL